MKLMENKQTAVEWLVEQFAKHYAIHQLDGEIEQAKQMEATTSKKEIVEISDEEIENQARQYTFDEYQKIVDYEKYDTYNDFISGAKWYREQLKNK